MGSFVTFTSVFLAVITLISCGLTDHNQPKEPRDFNHAHPQDSEGFRLDITKVINSLAQLPVEQAKVLVQSLKKLSNNFHGTIFGSLFSFVSNQLQNPSGPPSEFENMSKFKEQVISIDKLITNLRRLPEEVIVRSRPEFEKILQILGKLEAAKMFAEIGLVLNLRSVLGLDECTHMDDIPSKVVRHGKNQLPLTETVGQTNTREVMRKLTTKIGETVKENKTKKGSMQRKARPASQIIIPSMGQSSMTV